MKVLILLSGLLFVGCSHLKQGQRASTSRYLASKSCLQVFETKKIRTVGIEFEGFFNSNQTNVTRIAKYLLGYLDKHIPEKDFYPLEIQQGKDIIRFSDKKDLKKRKRLIQKREYAVFTIRYKQNSHLQEWEVKDEMSLDDATQYQRPLKGFEVSSPIIRSKASQNFFLSALKELSNRRDIFIKKPTDKKTPGGLHIHVSKEGFTEKDSLMLIKILILAEKQMFKYFNVSEKRKNSLHIRSFVEDLMYFHGYRTTLGENLYELSKSRWEYPLNQLLKDKNINTNLDKLAERLIKNPLMASKHYFFSIRNQFNTFEFRLFDSTVDPKIIQHEVEFVTKLSQAVLDKDPNFMRFVESKEKAQQEMTSKEFLEFLNILQINPIEIK